MRFPFYQNIPRKRGETFMKKDPMLVSHNMNVKHSQQQEDSGIQNIHTAKETQDVKHPLYEDIQECKTSILNNEENIHSKQIQKCKTSIQIIIIRNEKYPYTKQDNQECNIFILILKDNRECELSIIMRDSEI